MNIRLRAVAFALMAMLLAAAWPGLCRAGNAAHEVPVAEAQRCIREHSLLADAFDLQALREACAMHGAGGLRDFLKAADKYSSYTTPEELAFLKELGRNKPAGVGMDIFQDRQQRVRCVPYPGSPAEKAGVAYGDILKGVDGEPVRGQPLAKIAAQIRGEEGSAVMFSLHAEGQPMRTVVAERKRGEYPSVVRTGDSPAVIRILRFGPRTALDLRSCLVKLKKGQGCVIDLRGNTGGSMAAGMECARLFLKKGDVVLHLKERSGARTVRAEKNGPWSANPLVLVQDQFTASASELFIASLSAAGRARSSGAQSAGKACVQNLFTLSDGSILKLTTEKMLYPHREEDWEGTGIPSSSSSASAKE